MSKFGKAILVLSMVGLTSACAHTHRVEGNQEKSEIPEGVRVGIGAEEVVEGERVAVISEECKTVGSVRGPRKECGNTKLGHAVVLKVLGSHVAVVRPEDGLVMDESMQVEKDDEHGKTN